MTAFGRSALFCAVLVSATLVAGMVTAQARSSGTVNGINYTVVGGSNQSISGAGAGLEVLSDGVRIRVLPDAISVDGVEYPVDPFGGILIDQTNNGLRISVDGRDVLTVGPEADLARRADAGDLDAMNSLALT